MLAYIAVLTGAALIALASGLAFAGALRTITVRPRSAAPARRPMARHRSPGPAGLDDYGLLQTVALVENPETGRSVRDVLSAGGVRATIAIGSEGLTRVLVFPQEYDQARRMVSWVL